MLLWIPSFVLDGLILPPKCLVCPPFAAAESFWWCFALEFDTWEHSFKHDMLRSSRVHGDSDFHPFLRHFNDFLWARILTVLHTQIVTFDWLSAPCVCLVCWSPLVTAHFLCLPTNTTPAALHHCQCFFNVFSLIFINGVQVSVAALSTPRCNVSCFTTTPTCSVLSLAATFLPFASFLATAPSAMILSSCFPSLEPLPPWCPFSFPLWPFPKLYFASPFLCRRLATRDPRFPGPLFLSNFHHHLSLTFQSPSGHSSTSLSGLLQPCRWWCPPRQWEAHRTTSSFHGIWSSTSSRQQFLDCGHLFLICSQICSSIWWTSRAVVESSKWLHVFIIQKTINYSQKIRGMWYVVCPVLCGVRRVWHMDKEGPPCVCFVFWMWAYVSDWMRDN